MQKVILSLGSNIPPKKSTIQQAIAEIIKRKIGRILMIAPFYKTLAVGNEKQDWFVNTCILIETKQKPLELLETIQKIEHDFGRIRNKKWAARTLDIDIILFELSKADEEKFKNHPTLTIPHVEMKNRAFVLRPLFDLMPWLIFDGVPLTDLIEKTSNQEVELLVNKSDIHEEIMDMYWELEPRGINLGLERIKHCAELMGNPHLKLPPVIHIAGTNGKGSTAAILHNVLSHMGKKVHRFTSPHLLSYSERFILGLNDGAKRYISVDEFEILVSRIAPYVKQCKLSHFEALTMIAYLLFSENPADYVILETGMGGRLDATNIIPNPIATIITTISRDHTEYLGNMIEAIAYEKAGIIKEKVPVIVSAQFKPAVDVISERAKMLNAPLFRINHEWSIAEILEPEQNIKIDSFIYKDEEIFLDLLSLQGNYQLENAGAALATIIAIFGKHNLPKPEILDDALSNVRWPARLENLQPQDCNLPLNDTTEFIVDSAHNAEGLFSLVDYLKILNVLSHKETHFIISFKKGRDLQEAFAVLSSFPANYIFVKSHYAHEQCTPEDLERFAIAYGLKYKVVENWQFLISLFDDTEIYIKRYVVTGSMYFIGAFYKMIDYQMHP
jgi:dihydrofolate synthase / folylpolyglutamate synthase